MSMILCTSCSTLIDCDDDPECFIENPGVPTGFPEEVLCEPCRDRREAQEDKADAMCAMADSHNVIAAASVMQRPSRAVPDPHFCMSKSRCAGLRRCPRDPVCND